MPAAVTTQAVVLGLLVLSAMSAMLIANAWAILRLVLGEPLSPDPRPKPRLVPWGIWSVVLVVLLYLGVNFFVVNAYGLARKQVGFQIGPPAAAAAVAAKPDDKADDSEKSKLNFTEMMLLVSVVNVVVVACVPLVLRFGSGASLSEIGLNRQDIGRHVVTGLVAFLVVTPWVIAVNLVAVLLWTRSSHPLEGMLREGLTREGIALAYLSAVILAPLCEEMLFRGVMQGYLNKIRLTPRRRTELVLANGAALECADPDAPEAEPFPSGSGFSAEPERRRFSAYPIVLTSLVFAAVHAPQMPAPFAIFFLSLALGWLYDRTGSLTPSIVLHAAFNGFNTTLMILAISVQAGIEKDKAKAEPKPPAKTSSIGRENHVEKCGFRLAQAAGRGSYSGSLTRGSWDQVGSTDSSWRGSRDFS
jgi:membrane protease YdiL (CAAX protease family)